MASKSENAEIAVLQSQMEDVKSSVGDLTDEVKAMSAKLDTFALKSELKSFKWMTVPLVIILTAVLTALVAFFFAHSTPNPTTSTSTTTTTPTGSTSTTTTRDGVPSASANATAQSSASKPSDSQESTGGVDLTLPKLIP